MNKKYRFDITPHIVKQLGEQLVSDEITALLEIIKNSYDADADWVSIEINTTGQYLKDNLFFPNHNGFIVVEDNGFGMSEQTILKSWLLISFSEKRKFKEKRKKTPKGRTPLGEKGLGRLSTQRLADICEVFTNEKGKKKLHIGFDWRDFEKETTLGEVTVHKQFYEPKSKSGTKLILTNLKHVEVWKGRNLEKFKGQISQIISPFKKNRPFKVYLTINGVKVDIIESREELRDLAISNFEFKLQGSQLTIEGKTKLEKFVGNKREEYQNYLEADNGKKFYTFLTQKYPDILSAKEPFFICFKKIFNYEIDIGGIELNNGKKAHPGDFEGVIEEFSYGTYNKEDIEQVFGELADYRAFAQEQIGIKLYRNGFSIKPFGMDGDDWLKLRDSQTKGKSFYPLRPANVIGYFALDEGKNNKLKDKTDREGLISNPFSRNFFTLAFFIRDEVNRYQDRIRRTYNEFLKVYKTKNNGIKTTTQAFNATVKTANSAKTVKIEVQNATQITNETIESIKKATPRNNGPLFTSDTDKKNIEESQKLVSKLENLQKTIKKVEAVLSKTEQLSEAIDILKPKIENLEEQLYNFSELASLGLVAEAVSHEFATIAEKLAEKSSFYANRLKNKKLTNADIYVLIEYINVTVNGLKVQLRHLDPALKYSREKKSTFSLALFFKDEYEYYKSRFEKDGIQFKTVIKDDFSVRVNRGKLTQIVDNLFNNSQYWLKERKQKETTFKPLIMVEIEKPWIYISDNGFGIPKTIENQIFEPFITTKPKNQGRGLGLFIVRQLLDSFGATIALEPKKNKGDRKYIFAINLNNIVK